LENEQIKLLKENYTGFLGFLRANYPIFHNSNLFLRDLQYGIFRFLEKKGYNLSLIDAKELAVELIRFLEEKGIFVPINNITWKLNFPDFVTRVPGDPL
jgi:hypothetical protein